MAHERTGGDARSQYLHPTEDSISHERHYITFAEHISTSRQLHTTTITEMTLLKYQDVFEESHQG